MQHARVVALLASRREVLAGVRGIDCRFLARIGLPRLRLPQLRACCLPAPHQGRLSDSRANSLESARCV